MWIALLGRRDAPTDGVEDYCTFLGEALGRRGVTLKRAHVEWHDRGWLRALWKLLRTSADWRGNWVALQYTALGWSQRGFPFGAVAALEILCRRGARCAVVFHEPFGLGGPRWIDRIREACQNWVVRTLYRRSAKSIFTVSLETIAWLPKGGAKADFIPIGANVPGQAGAWEISHRVNGTQKQVAVFCLSDPPNRHREVDEISQALSAAARTSKVRVVFLGKGTVEAKDEIERAFLRVPVEVSNLGLRSADEVSQTLAESDAMLCVRGPLYARRGSAIAGIACGLPIVAYGDGANIFPLSEAGVRLAPYPNREALGNALAQILNDSELRERLRARSRRAHEKYFSWDAIAERFIQALHASRETE